MKGATNRDVHWRGSKKIRSQRDFLEENRKLVQFNDDHPETEKTRIQTGAIKGRNLVLTGQKSDTGKGRSPRDCIAEKGLPCAEEIQLINYLINLWNPLAQWEGGNFYCCQWRKESNLPGSSELERPAESFPCDIMAWHRGGVL
jgi:hypothetical protein